MLGVSTLATASPATTALPAGALTGEVPPVAVEDFNYPGAARILAEEGIALKRGDGQLVLADCNSAVNQIKVHTVADSSVGRKELYCFKANSTSGYLTMDLPRVIALESTGPSFSADLTAGGAKTTVTVAKDGFRPVGEGDIPSGAVRSVVVEIRVTG
ncbi:hypothetical protein ACFQ9J_26950 [Streptomyces sp. NPDC056529]|uniref:hypothetical protein n=1 Tax=Streptomyces sp. NPDC056529 TaxID=3345855 RepID=UPI0036CD6D5E